MGRREACTTTRARDGFVAGRGRVRAAARMAAAAAAVATTVLSTLIAGVGPRYGRTGRTGVAVSLGARLVLAALGISVRRRGEPAPGGALVVANHVSWLDVLVIAGAAPVVPVATCEVAGWPVLGPLAARIGAVFVSRRADRELPEAVGRMTAVLRRGHRVLVFPEATSACGGPPKPFRRASFQAAVDAAAVIAPVSVRYADGRGGATTSAAFVGDGVLIRSVWRVVRSGRMAATVRWLPVVPAIADGGHRATHRARAAGRAHDRIARALTGEDVVRSHKVVKESPLVIEAAPVSVEAPGRGR